MGILLAILGLSAVYWLLRRLIKGGRSKQSLRIEEAPQATPGHPALGRGLSQQEEDFLRMGELEVQRFIDKKLGRAQQAKAASKGLLDDFDEDDAPN